MIFSQQLESRVLGGLINNPEVYPEVASILKPEDFYNELHEIIYIAIKNTLNNKEVIDKLVVSLKLSQYNIASKDGVSITQYLDAICLNKVPAKNLIQSVRELKKFSLRRSYSEMGKQIIKQMKANGDLTEKEMISFVDSLVYRQLENWNTQNDVIDLFDGLYELVEERGNNPRVEVGIESPYPEFNRMYGGFKAGNVYVFCARPAEGKALEENALIPTPCGYKKIKDLIIGDEVFAIDGTVTKVLATKRWKNRNLYKIEAFDGSEVLADEEHEWEVVTYGSGWTYRKKVLTSKDIFKHQEEFGHSYELPHYAGLRLPEVNLSVDPFTFGKALGEETGVLTKRIPVTYLRASFNQRLEVLKGLISSAANYTKHTAWFHDPSSLFIEDVIELIRSLGIKATPFKSDKYPNEYAVEYPYYSGGITCRFNGPRHIKVEPAGKGATVCIEIEHESHLFLCGKGMMPTHNSSLLNHTSFSMSCLSENSLPCLILDTEMGQDNAVDVKFRLMSSLTGINPWYFETGNWRKNEAMYKTVREEKVNGETLEQRCSKYKNKLSYRYITNASIDNIISTIKSWYYSKVGRGNPCIISYDYIKIAGESMSESNKEYQIIGEKVNRLKELVGEEVNAPLLTAVQLNRTGDNRTSGHSDSSSAISTSDRILWFATYVGIFRKKTLEEVADETDQHGTHKLITLKSRFQGRDAAGHNIFVKKPDGGLTYNFLNFSVDNFKVTEKSSAESMYEDLDAKSRVTIPPKPKKDSNSQASPF